MTVPPTASPIPSSEQAAAEDRRMALIIAGVVVGVAVLLTALTLILMAVLSHADEESSLEGGVRMTMAPIGKVKEEALIESERIIGQRLEALGIHNYRISHGSGMMNVEIPPMKDVDRIRRVIACSGNLQFRQVLEVLGAGDPSYETTEVTQIDFSYQEAYQALRDQEIVLEKEEGGSVYKIRLGPTRLTSDTVAEASYSDDLYNPGRWVIDFTLTEAAAGEFADLTTELSKETVPENQLAIVLDYEILSYPRVNEAIIGGKGQITGIFYREMAQDLALVIRLGALPVDFTMPVMEAIGE